MVQNTDSTIFFFNHLKIDNENAYVIILKKWITYVSLFNGKNTKKFL